MRRKFRFRLRRKHKIIFWSTLICAVSLLAVWYIDRNIHPILVQIAETQVKEVAQQSITDGIGEQLKLGNHLNQVMKVEKDSTGNISYIETDPQIQAEIYQQTTDKIQKILLNLKDKPIQISLGQAIDSNLFANYGPPITIEVWPKGSIKVSIEPKLQSQGINMVMVTMNLNIHTEMELIIPFSEESIPIDIHYPIAEAMVVGKVPNYYFYSDQGEVKQMIPTIPTK